MRSILFICAFFCAAAAVGAAEVTVPPLEATEMAEKQPQVPSPDRLLVDAGSVKPVTVPLVIGDDKKAAAKPVVESSALSALVREALRNNPDLKAIRANKEQALGQSHYERRGYFPRIAGLAGYETFPDTANTGQSERSYRRGAGANIDQMLWDFNETRGKVHQKYHEALAESEKARAKEVDIAYDVTEAYWRAVMYGKIVDYRKRSVAALKKNAKAVSDRVKANNARPADFKGAVSRQAEAEENLLRAENGLKLAKQRLLFLVGRDVDGDIQLDDQLSATGKPVLPGLNVDTHPDMKNIRSAQDAARAAERAAKALLFPRFYFRGTWKNEHSEPGGGISFMPPDGYVYKLGLNIKIPIGSEWVAGRGKLKEARAKSAQLQNQAKSVRQGIKLQVAEAKFKLDEAVKGLDVAQKRYAASKAKLDLAEQQHKAKNATSSDVANAEDKLARAEISRFRAAYDAKCAEALVLHAMGITAGK